MRSETKSLFERVAELSGCLYLSDLTRGADRAAVALALREILPHEHSLSEWVELASYVTGESGGYESADAARAALLDYFEE